MAEYFTELQHPVSTVNPKLKTLIDWTQIGQCETPFTNTD